ncbi:MAG: fumarylacetoacetate hydrolase family protein [SAR324 cluster bacterium]|nr:fumarylacetoacetate hydrolase family protein [SAR324 cluster bacterium]
MKYAIPLFNIPTIDVAGQSSSFPVHRIYCVGRNYAAHAREMGSDPKREPPCFFTKPGDSVVANGSQVPYPSATENLHHEVELVVAIGKDALNISADKAKGIIFGYAVGNDLTRRDLQAQAKKLAQPWDVAKGFDHSAPITAIHPVEKVGHLEKGEIWLKVNDDMRQHGHIEDMVWSIPEVIEALSKLFRLIPGDLIFTGTPAGVGALSPGDKVEGCVEGLDILKHTVV